MPHFDITSIVLAAATIVGTWLGTRIIRPRDHERAVILDTIARGAAAIVVSLNPGAKWADLLASVVNNIASSASVPTKSRDAIERAAASALAGLGKRPSD
jgi:hypothetical protein